MDFNIWGRFWPTKMLSIFNFYSLAKLYRDQARLDLLKPYPRCYERTRRRGRDLMPQCLQEKVLNRVPPIKSHPRVVPKKNMSGPSKVWIGNVFSGEFLFWGELVLSQTSWNQDMLTSSTSRPDHGPNEAKPDATPGFFASVLLCLQPSNAGPLTSMLEITMDDQRIKASQTASKKKQRLEFILHCQQIRREKVSKIIKDPVGTCWNIKRNSKNWNHVREAFHLPTFIHSWAVDVQATAQWRQLFLLPLTIGSHLITSISNGRAAMLHLGQQWQELLLKDFKSYLHVHGMYSRGSLISTRKFKERDLKIAREMAKLTLVNFEGSPYSKFLLQQDSKGEKSTEHVSLVRFECQSSASKSRDLHFGMARFNPDWDDWEHQVFKSSPSIAGDYFFVLPSFGIFWLFLLRKRGVHFPQIHPSLRNSFAASAAVVFSSSPISTAPLGAVCGMAVPWSFPAPQVIRCIRGRAE